MNSYANRAKNIKNQPRINEDPKDALLRKFQEEISRLKEQLGNKGRTGRKSRRHRNRDGNEIDDGFFTRMDVGTANPSVSSRMDQKENAVLSEYFTRNNSVFAIRVGMSMLTILRFLSLTIVLPNVTGNHLKLAFTL